MNSSSCSFFSKVVCIPFFPLVTREFFLSFSNCPFCPWSLEIYDELKGPRYLYFIEWNELVGSGNLWMEKDVCGNNEDKMKEIEFAEDMVW